MFISDSQLNGLYQRERTTGNKWVVKAKQRGINKPVTVTLGRVDVIPVREARRLAKEKLALLADGINPNTQARQSREVDEQLGVSLQQALEEYLNLRELKPSTIKSYRQVVARSFSDWLDRPLRGITRQMVVKRYQEIQKGIAKRMAQPEKANPRGLAEAQKAMRYLSAIMNSYANDTIGGVPVLPDGNTVLVLKDKRARTKLKARKRFLDANERETIFEELSHTDHPEYKGKLKPREADFVFLLMVTGLRLEEAKQLRWENITELTYTITDTKNEVDHTLPITPTIASLLERNRSESEWVFPGRNNKAASMSSAVKNVSLETGIQFSAHDLRRTAATIAAEHGFSRDQIGRLLNHSDGNVTEGYIQKTTTALLPMLEVIEAEILGNYKYE
jgi:integrase